MDCVVVIRNEWGENHVTVGELSQGEAVAWIASSEREPGNRGYTYEIMPLIPPDEYVNGEWITKQE